MRAAVLCLAAAGLVLVAPFPRASRRRSHPGRAPRLGIDRRTAALCAVVAAATGALGWILTGVAALAGLAAIAAASTPLVVEHRAARAAAAARREAWPAALDVLVASLRSGDPLTGAVTSTAERVPAALAPAFGRFATDLRQGVDFDTAAGATARELDDPTSETILATLRLARRAGGRATTDVMLDLARHVRAEIATEKEVAARQAWVAASARLAAAAPWMLLALTAIRPGGLDAFRSLPGNTVLAVAAAMSLTGYLAAMRIGTGTRARGGGTAT